MGERKAGPPEGDFLGYEGPCWMGSRAGRWESVCAPREQHSFAAALNNSAVQASVAGF